MKGFTLVLGGGAARGLAHLGVLRALLEMNLMPRRIVGCSMGALVGAAFCSTMDIKRMEEIAFSITRRKVAELFRPFPSTSGITDGFRIVEFLNPLLGGKRAEELEIKFGAVAVDLCTGNEVFLKSGALSTLVRASISIPGIFTPLNMDGKILVDGGVIDPLPVKVARLWSDDLIIAVNVLTKVKPALEESTVEIEDCFENPKKYLRGTRGWNIFQILVQSMALLQSGLIKEILELNPPDILIEPEVEHIKLYEFYRAKEAHEAGYVATLDKKDIILKLLAV